MAGWTNRGKHVVMASAFLGPQSGKRTDSFYVALCRSGDAGKVNPSTTTNTLTELAEIPAANGYTAGGLIVTGVDFSGHIESDADNAGFVQLRDFIWTGAGGNIPSTGNGISFLVLTMTGAVAANRDVIAFWNLSGNFTVSDTQTFTVKNARLSLTE